MVSDVLDWCTTICDGMLVPQSLSVLTTIVIRALQPTTSLAV